MKKIIILCVTIVSFHIVNAQSKITGKITDQDSIPLPGVTIMIPETNKSAMSDKSGNYSLENVPNGKTRVVFSCVGYANIIEIIQIYVNDF